jgi:ankyrin repeat protein
MECNRTRALELLDAARAGDLARVRTLLPPCGDPAADGVPDAPDGMTPLMEAAAGGHEAVVELLLRCGADAARRDARGRSAAWHARAAGHLLLAERLDGVVDKEKTIW